ncbi:hypothetical protein M1L60_04425 [Actinoplanes sp. TRM 88003]|uniref:DUF6891 domain-containing protein n=1 Tax=Paractinoplanes aksuensis TaxID=2939490 RepID=A0ABT1DG71_9ACTN|nr:hypothetical protein [Actinoplanes aksuensis]MCO8269836.1 hypothetical protein [Actinoplanes aksuensis]
MDQAVEYLADEHDDAGLAEVAWAVAREEFAAHLAEQASWPSRTDNDRLTDAFRALDTAGIVARQDFACCQNCGVAEIGDEVRPELPARGYVFYHHQDAERAVEGGGVYLCYGSFEGAPAATVGEEVAVALRAEGLSVNWGGSAGQRIHVPLRWARRRHGSMAAYGEKSSGTAELDLEVSQSHGEARPRNVLEVMDIVRRLPTRGQAWLSAVNDAGCVQVAWEDGRLWLETPDAAARASIGKYATLAEVEQTLTVLAVEQRVAVSELDGVTARPW